MKSAKSKIRDNVDDYILHDSLSARGVSEDCAVPCGYYNQLCCAQNQVCYTDSNNQAQCSSTAVETVTSTAVTTSVYVASQTLVSIETILNTPSDGDATTAIQTSLATVTYTSVYTASQTLTSLITLYRQSVGQTTTMVHTSVATLVHTSILTATPTASGSAGNATQAVNAATLEPSHHLSTGAKAAIGVCSAVGILLIAGLAFWLWRRHAKKIALRQVEQDGQQMAPGHMQNAAVFPSRSVRQAFDPPVGSDAFRQRPSQAPEGPNPFDEIAPPPSQTWISPDDVLQTPPAYGGDGSFEHSRQSTPQNNYRQNRSSHSTPVQDFAGPSTQSMPGYQDYENIPPIVQEPRRVKSFQSQDGRRLQSHPRRSQQYMRPTMEDRNEQ